VSEFTLEVGKRTEFGSAANRRLRSQGLLPAVLYARDMDSVAVSISDREFSRLARLAGASQVFSLKSEDGEINGRSVLVKDIQQDWVKGRVLHVDFQVLHDNEEIEVRVPLNFVGEAPGVKIDGGVLTIAVHDLGVRCLPRYIPRSIEVDISRLGIGSSIHAGDIPLPENVALYDQAEEAVVSVVASRTSTDTTAGGGPAAEGGAAGAPAAEGAADAPKK
jgi:large subunit ribosomal protein L25